MRQLKKVIASILIVIVLQFCKTILNENSYTYTYYYNLFSCYQLLLLFWCVISILLEELFLIRLYKKRVNLVGFGIFLLLFLGAEGTCTYWLNHPNRIPKSLFSLFKIYYDDFDCKIIQYSPQYSQYDETLYYKLKGNDDFVFANREFADSFHTNSAGLRDNEESLNRPSIICIGDSYTLGWGNSEETNFPAMIERKSGQKVLNLSMSSYGTAREFMKLKTIDTTNVHYIFWQYCFNDEAENRVYIKNDFSLPVQPPKNFDSVVKLHEWTRKYFPGRHFLTIFKLGLRKMIFGKPLPTYASTDPPSDAEQEQKARDFLEIIARAPVEFSKCRIVVFELNPYPLNNAFINKVKRLVNTDEFKGRFKNNIIAVDLSSVLSRDDFYVFDVHVQTNGNEKIVNSLLRAAGIQ